jgi:hypothetical protein
MEAMVEFLPRLPLRHRRQRRHPSSLKRQWRRGRPDSRPHIVGRVEGPSDTQDGGRIEKVEARWGGKAGGIDIQYKNEEIKVKFQLDTAL